jgi:hypothetical protein
MSLDRWGSGDFLIFAFSNLNNKIMTKVFFLISLVFFNTAVMGQAKNSGGLVPLRAENWEFKPGAVEFVAAGQGGGSVGAGSGEAAMKIVDGRGLVSLKGVDFSDGVIEFDILPEEKQFSLMYFRYKDSLESECFYFRTDRVGQPQAIQYTPLIGGVNCWNIFDNYQTAAEWQANLPIHTKLVVSGRRMRVYLNHAGEAALDVPRLEGNATHGTICFQGKGTLSNLAVRQGQTEGLPAAEGFDPVANDPHYIRRWQVTEPELIPKDVDFSFKSIPDSQRVWKPIGVERMGLVNLTRMYPYKDFVRRIVFLKTTLHSDKERTCQLQLGFMNEVWVFLNGQWLYVDKNFYGAPIAKQRGRISIENSKFTVPLQQGDNVLLIGVGGGFFGWGVMARVDELEGITMK